MLSQGLGSACAPATSAGWGVRVCAGGHTPRHSSPAHGVVHVLGTVHASVAAKLQSHGGLSCVLLLPCSITFVEYVPACRQ